MKRSLAVVVPITAIALLLVAVTASGTPRPRPARSVTVIEHATRVVTTDTGAPGDSAGDLLTFANDLFDSGDTRKVGTDQGYCVRVVAGAAFECTWTNMLQGGQLVVAGPFFDARDSTLAITGGTGRYRNARGSMRLHAMNGGAKFRFAFHITLIAR